MKVGIIGERNNYISYSMLYKSLKCKNVEIIWFIDAKISEPIKKRLYGNTFDYGPIIKLLRMCYDLFRSWLVRTAYDCKVLCNFNNIPYIVPAKLSINNGLPCTMYSNAEADYALIAGCDQILNENGLTITKNKIINYHYSALPAYRGKNVVFWQWYNREPFIGFSFHEVNIGIDTGESIYQGKVGYNFDEPLSKLIRRVIDASSDQICKVYECLNTGTKVILPDPSSMTYYPAKKYIELRTVSSSKRIPDVMAVFKRVGDIRLPNGLTISRVSHVSYQKAHRYEICRRGIKIPLSDGHILGNISRRIPFFIFRFLIGKRRLLRGLN
jgi:hypothetical protein